MDQYSAALLAAVDSSFVGWLQNCAIQGCVRGLGACSDDLAAAALQMAQAARPIVVCELEALLSLDPEQQRTNPLSVLREAVRFPAALLLENAVPTPVRSSFDARILPLDVYGLGPANWADVDPSLSEPGLIWGAWKAKTILDRHRAEPRK